MKFSICYQQQLITNLEHSENNNASETISAVQFWISKLEFQQERKKEYLAQMTRME